MSWREVADGVFYRRYRPWDVNVCVVRAADGLLVVDTRASQRQAAELRTDLEQLGAPRWVVNTHGHFDHTFGNVLFAALPIYGHARVSAHLERYGRPLLDEWPEEVIVAPTELVGDLVSLDLGDRGVRLLHLGRGHTDNDLLVHVPDADAWLVGDVIEQSGPPMYDSDSFPLEWGATALRLAAELDPAATIVPGHGKAVDAGFVQRQAGELAAVAELLAELHAAAVPAADAVAAGAGRWPYPETAGLQAAVDAAYEALGGGLR